MPQMYKVEDLEHKLVMIAPMETIQKVWRLENPAIARIAASTADLKGACNIQSSHQLWPVIFIQRLPLELAHKGYCNAQI